MAGLMPIAFGILLVAEIGKAQIPEPCANANSFTNRECCPTPENVGSASNAGPCGSNLTPSRGACVDIPNPYNNIVSESDTRQNWPHFYFTRICNCSSNYGGYDCGECAFGYRGPNCDQKYIRQRRSTSELTDEEWRTYISQLRMAKSSTTSRYRVIISPPDYNNLAELQTVPIGVYHSFIWFHHYVAKDTPDGGPDYAHRATGFPTWHRLFLLWFEREMQHFLQDETFTVHYWDWRNETERTSLFQSNRLGAHDSSSSAVTGELVDEWRTICWYGGNAESGDIPDHRDNQNICDPSSDTGLLRRCPDKERCAANYSGWPSYQDVETAVGMEEYDRSPYNRLPCESFRNYMEGFHVGCDSGTRGVDLCENGYQRLLHNTVHILLGFGHFPRDSIPNNQKGVMGDVAASPNDPIFINHHTMIDCILEEWLQRNIDDVEYPSDKRIDIGHRRDDYIVPFIPLYTNNMMYKLADNFGYTCSIPDVIPTTQSTTTSTSSGSTARLCVVVMAIMGIVTLIL